MGKLREAFKLLGFSGVEEVALGADLCSVQEADYFIEEVPDKMPFMATSCCPHGRLWQRRNSLIRRMCFDGTYANDTNGPYDSP